MTIDNSTPKDVILENARIVHNKFISQPGVYSALLALSLNEATQNRNSRQQNSARMPIND